MDCRTILWRRKAENPGHPSALGLHPVFVLLVFLLLGGCSNRSVFTGLDYPDTERIAGYSGERLLSALEVNVRSPAFYRALTPAQRERILATLDSMIAQEKRILTEGGYSRFLSRSAKAAVEILIHSDSLVYDIIYNLADPALSALSLSGISIEELYVAYTEPIRNLLRRGVEGALAGLALAFSNLYRISRYYGDAVRQSPYGVYSGGDLQTYLLAGILGGLIESTQKLVREVYQDYQRIARELGEAYYRLVASGTADGELVDRLLEALAQKLEAPLESLISGYKLELEFVAGIFEAMAANAGYGLAAQETARIIRSWGK